MKVSSVIVSALLISAGAVAQNDIDALRYSQTGVGGNARFMSMGGAFGALGANISCLNFNPAGLAMYRKGEMNLSPGIRFSSIGSTYNGNSQSTFKPALTLNGLGLAAAWKSKKNENDRHSIGFSLNQLQNFNNSISISGYSSNGNSIMKDFLNDAGTTAPANLDPSYTGLAFQTYLLDTINGHYYGFIDPSKKMLQSKTIATSGKMNELAFGYAYTFQDKLYLGASIGVPIIDYTYNSSYSETDDKDSLHIDPQSGSSTYSYPVYYYQGYGGFKSMTYNESYHTSGHGYNLKLGAIYRLNDYLRIGVNYQTPTVLNLTDTYSYSMTTTWDEGQSSTSGYPENGGTYKYRIITPMRYGASLGFIYNKLLSVGIDYETLDYSQAQVTSDTPSDFTGVNKTIRSKYSRATNLRVGVELNTSPVIFRVGYMMYGSPFGQVFSGPFVTNSLSAGVGFKSRNWVFDVGLIRQMSKSTYYMYNPQYVAPTNLNNLATSLVATIGLKF